MRKYVTVASQLRRVARVVALADNRHKVVAQVVAQGHVVGGASFP